MRAWLADQLRRWLAIAPLTAEQCRERRMDAALRYMAGGGVAMTAIVGLISWQLALAKAVWPLLYVALGAEGIIAVVMTTYAWILGRTGLKVTASKDGIEIQDSAA